MCVTYGNNTKSVLLCFTDNTHNVLCVTYGKENITMTELKDKATAPIKQRASKYKAIPASESHIHINITDNAPLETKERDKYIIIEGRANNYQVVRYRINGKYIVIATISLRVQGTNSFNEKHYHIKSKSNKNDIYSCFVEMLQRFKNLYRLTINQENYNRIAPLLSTEDKARLKQMLQNYITHINQTHIQELKQFLSVGMNQAIEDNLNYLKIDVLAENIDQQAEETTECIK